MRMRLLIHKMKTAVLIWSYFAICATAGAAVKVEHFDNDPGWDAHNNRIIPAVVPTVVQDFGFDRTNFAGKAAGEMGGRIMRASEPAFYADNIGALTLDDKLSASGSFALTKTTAASGIFFGFFKAEQPGGGGRPIGSLGMDFDGEGNGVRMAVRLITGQNQSCGTFITPFIPGKFRPAPIRNDGTRYAWKLDYDPQANDGKGRFTFVIHNDAHKPDELSGKPGLPENYKQEALRRFPQTTTFAVDLPAGFKQQKTTYDHFGLMNMMKAGGTMMVHFDDLEYVGHRQDFSEDPKWDASGNRTTYKATDVGGAHNFGFSKTNYAGGQVGEVGGTFWRTEQDWGYYADKFGPLTFEDRLEARGKIVMVVGGPDAEMCFGWFRAGGKESPKESGDFVGIKVGGPTRVGHYFGPMFSAGARVRGTPRTAPLLIPGKKEEWSLIYDPAANHGDGAIAAKLGEESVVLNLKPGQKAAAREARLDHFGMFSIGPGGQIVKIYLDDLEYTAGAGEK